MEHLNTLTLAIFAECGLDDTENAKVDRHLISCPMCFEKYMGMLESLDEGAEFGPFDDPIAEAMRDDADPEDR